MSKIQQQLPHLYPEARNSVESRLSHYLYLDRKWGNAGISSCAPRHKAVALIEYAVSSGMTPLNDSLRAQWRTLFSEVLVKPSTEMERVLAQHGINVLDDSLGMSQSSLQAENAVRPMLTHREKPLSLELGIFIAAVRDPICDSIFAQWGQLSDEEREKVSQVLTSYLELYPSVVHADRDIRFNKLFYAHTERGDAKMRSSLKLSDLRHPLGWG